jgi:hypothetical protein
MLHSPRGALGSAAAGVGGCAAQPQEGGPVDAAPFGYPSMMPTAQRGVVKPRRQYDAAMSQQRAKRSPAEKAWNAYDGAYSPPSTTTTSVPATQQRSTPPVARGVAHFSEGDGGGRTMPPMMKVRTITVAPVEHIEQMMEQMRVVALNIRSDGYHPVVFYHNYNTADTRFASRERVYRQYVGMHKADALSARVSREYDELEAALRKEVQKYGGVVGAFEIDVPIKEASGAKS